MTNYDLVSLRVNLFTLRRFKISDDCDYETHAIPAINLIQEYMHTMFQVIFLQTDRTTELGYTIAGGRIYIYTPLISCYQRMMTVKYCHFKEKSFFTSEKVAALTYL